MKNMKMTIAYDGTRYKGWQGQKSTDATISGKIEAVLNKYTGEEIHLIGSGRTDAGVHASEQVANVHLKGEFLPEELFQSLNHYLPEDIAVLTVEEVDERFHSRFSAEGKWYRYRICTGIKADVFARKYVYHCPQNLDIEQMKLAAAHLVGTYDFTSFCGNNHLKKTAVRTITEIRLTRKADEILIDFYGEGFLQNMIRIITGTLIEVGNGTRTSTEIPAILEGKNRALAGFTAPPQGLILQKVFYKGD